VSESTKYEKKHGSHQPDQQHDNKDCLSLRGPSNAVDFYFFHFYFFWSSRRCIMPAINRPDQSSPGRRSVVPGQEVVVPSLERHELARDAHVAAEVPARRLHQHRRAERRHRGVAAQVEYLKKQSFEKPGYH
jgi:hypothetical protein